MLDSERFRPPDLAPDEFKEDFREAVLLLGLHYNSLYREAGDPFGPSVEAMFLWMRYGRQARSN